MFKGHVYKLRLSRRLVSPGIGKNLCFSILIIGKHWFSEISLNRFNPSTLKNSDPSPVALINQGLVVRLARCQPMQIFFI